ncbi:MAG: polyprenyl synthetase family protein [Lachnospiraceae bacterium]|nr:polyprenyl synthetase family protein [Lachnospiraceae bacterium]
MTAEEFRSQLDERIADAESIIKSFLPKEEGYQKLILEAMNYSVLAGGKRLRPIFMKESAKLFGDMKLLSPFMAAIEMIHTYSLVHDDLPAMDNDELRRGRKTTWKVYGEDQGILAGDGLLNFSMETALKAYESAENLEDHVRIAKALQVLYKKSGVYGMVGGQCVDVYLEGAKTPMDMDTLMFIHKNKTAALIEASMMVGAILAGADDGAVAKIEKCAYNIGIAFQIRDDILDVIGTGEELGKPIGSDAGNEKQTYVDIKGIDESEKDVEAMSKEATEILESLPGDHEFLKELILSLVDRRK